MVLSVYSARRKIVSKSAHLEFEVTLFTGVALQYKLCFLHEETFDDVLPTYSSFFLVLARLKASRNRRKHKSRHLRK